MAITYLDFIQSEECCDRKKELRQKFQSFILTSELIRPKYLLSRLDGIEDDLSQEKAAIYGKVCLEKNSDHELNFLSMCFKSILKKLQPNNLSNANKAFLCPLIPFVLLM